MQNMNLNKKLSILARQLGVNYFGVCDLSLAKEFIISQGGEILKDYQLGISLGIKMPNDIVDLLPQRANKAVASSYRLHAYEYINQRLNYITSFLSNIIQESGYPVLPVPAAERYDDKRICAIFSHKLTAHLAGLGWIGKSCLLVTPDSGPRVRWSTILTNAPLKVTGKPMADQCGECMECISICPQNAFTNRNFQAEEPREKRYHADKCSDYFENMKAKGELPVCGLCVYICPYGR